MRTSCSLVMVDTNTDDVSEAFPIWRGEERSGVERRGEERVKGSASVAALQTGLERLLLKCTPLEMTDLPAHNCN